MAIIKCKGCGSDISSTAEICPNCGKKVTGEKTYFILIVIGIVIVVLIGILLLVFNTPKSNKVTQNEILKSSEEENENLEVKNEVIAFREALKKANDKGPNMNVSTLKETLEELKEAFTKFDALEVNENDPIGKYVISVRTNEFYTTYKKSILFSNELDLSYDFSVDTASTLTNLYTEELLNIEYNIE